MNLSVKIISILGLTSFGSSWYSASKPFQNTNESNVSASRPVGAGQITGGSVQEIFRMVETDELQDSQTTETAGMFEPAAVRDWWQY